MREFIFSRPDVSLYIKSYSRLWGALEYPNPTSSVRRAERRRTVLSSDGQEGRAIGAIPNPSFIKKKERGLYVYILRFIDTNMYTRLMFSLIQFVAPVSCFDAERERTAKSRRGVARVKRPRCRARGHSPLRST